MALKNLDRKEIFCKILLQGMSGAGKTENLRAIQRLSESRIGRFRPDPISIFEFLPLSLGRVGGFDVRLHLYALPSQLQVSLAGIEGMLLTGLDAVIFIVDSRKERLAANKDALQATEELLLRNQFLRDDIDFSFQYNHRDAEDALAPEVLRETLNPENYPEQQAIASIGMGSLETLKGVAQRLLYNL